MKYDYRPYKICGYKRQKLLFHNPGRTNRKFLYFWFNDYKEKVTQKAYVGYEKKYVLYRKYNITNN